MWPLFWNDINDQAVINITGVADTVLTFYIMCLMVSFSKYCTKMTVIKPDIGEPIEIPLAGL